jgi:hypothetical protein
MRTSILDTDTFSDPLQQERAFARARSTGATMVRLPLAWATVAPLPPTPLTDPANPTNLTYNWAFFDRQVQLAVSRGLDPLVVITYAPVWAERPSGGPPGTNNPDPAAYGAFARAAATRYSGRFPGLPRVRYWQAWNEPNRDYYLMPQYSGGHIVSALNYRATLSHFWAGVKAAHPGNVVVAGGLAPYGRAGKPAPFAFMRELFCLSKSLRRTCDLRGAPLRFDVWSHHPYTYGGPTHRAGGDNIALGDLPRLRRFIRAAIRAGHARPGGRVGLWATELGWDSNPPDPRALPTALHARWTSEALYRLWQNGFSVATWWRIQDDPVASSRYQSGFYTVAGQAKPSLRAFRFPVVALRRGRGVYVWGRTPTSRSGRVVLQLRRGTGWRNIGAVRANRYGIFTRTLRISAGTGHIRARFRGETSLGFSLKPVRDRYVDPFGT